MTTRAEPLLAAAKQRLVGYFADHWPDIGKADAGEVGEVAVRLALSYIVLPGTTETVAAQRIARVAAHVLDARRVQS
jgi:hypothetical protein